jgi:predicted dehydrogenase
MDGSNNRQIFRVLVVGVGSIGERHVRCLLKSGRARVSICETNDRIRDDIGQRYDIANRFANLDSALSEPHDVAVIAVPADLHITVARQAAAAGLHVLIEKPLAVTLDRIDDLQLTIDRETLTAAVAYAYRAHPALAAMREAIRAGSFGRPVQLAVIAGQNFPTYRPAYRDTYYVSRARGGGAVQDALTHLINAAEWLVGPVDRVVADADHKLLGGVEVEDVVNVLARHGNVIASYSLNQYQSPNETTITVVCEHGTVRFEYHNHRWRHMRCPDEPWQDEPFTWLERDTLFTRQAESFLDAIEGLGPPLCSLEDGLQSLQVNLAILASIENGGWQAVCKPRRSLPDNCTQTAS